MKRLLRYIVIVLILSGCTPQRRLERLLERHPELMEQKDTAITITKIDTLFLQGDSASVVFDLSKAKESAAMYDGRWTIAEVDAVHSSATLTLLDPNLDLFRLDVRQDPDTVVFVRTDTVKVKETIYKTKTEYVEKDPTWYDQFLSGFGLFSMIILILFLCYVIIKRFSNNH